MRLHPDTMPFLQELAAHNNRDWFNDHKTRWIAIKEDFETFTQGLIDEMKTVAPTLAGLTAKQCVYRIYRDTRFSPDKTPYKTHIACFLPSWGKKNNGVPGYYFQVGMEAYGLPGNCNLGGGIFMPDAATLAAIRQEIFYCVDEFRAIMNESEYRHYFGNAFFTMKKLSRVPKGYPADWEHADLLKYKDYTTAYVMPDHYIDSEALFDQVIKVWRASVPLNQFIQRAMEDVRGMM